MRELLFLSFVALFALSCSIDDGMPCVTCMHQGPFGSCRYVTGTCSLGGSGGTLGGNDYECSHPMSAYRCLNICGGTFYSDQNCRVPYFGGESSSSYRFQFQCGEQ